jgi:hypothetical protein
LNERYGLFEKHIYGFLSVRETVLLSYFGRQILGAPCGVPNNVKFIDDFVVGGVRLLGNRLVCETNRKK